MLLLLCRSGGRFREPGRGIFGALFTLFRNKETWREAFGKINKSFWVPPFFKKAASSEAF